MPQHDKAILEGEITEVFAHRVVVRTAEGSALADLGPKLAGKVAPKIGDAVKLSGERKPSELKVAIFERGGETTEAKDHADTGHDDHGDHGHDDHAPADPALALGAVTSKGHKVVAEPRRKPKHFEVLAQDREGTHHEHHVGLDGDIRKSKPGDPADNKWQLRAAAEPA